MRIEEHRVGDGQIAFFQPNACTVAVVDEQPRKHQPIDPRAFPAKHQARLVLAHDAFEHRFARHVGDEGNRALFHHRAIAIEAGCNPDRTPAPADRIDRFLKSREGLSAFLDRERPGIGLRECRERNQRRGDEQGQSEAH